MVLMLALILLLILLDLFLIAPRLPRRPLGRLADFDYAHRGLWDEEKPENSLPAFRSAAERGFGIETDVHITKDDRLVVFHDDTLERMCGDPRRIADCTLSELQALRLAGTGETIPTLDAMLETVAGRVPLIIEIKSDRRIGLLTERTDARLRTYAGPYCIESFDPRAVRWYRKHRPEIIRGQLAFGFRKGASWKRGAKTVFIASLLQNALGRPDFIAFDFESDRSLPFRLARRMGPSTAAWTVRSQADMDSLRGRYDLQIFERFVPKGR